MNTLPRKNDKSFFALEKVREWSSTISRIAYQKKDSAVYRDEFSIELVAHDVLFESEFFFSTAHMEET